jgi:hypothetical protein
MFSFDIGLHCSLYIVSYQGCQILEREEEEIEKWIVNQILTQTYNIRLSP